MNMDDLDNDALMLARGKYSTLNAARQDALKRLAKMGEEMQSAANGIMKYAQGDELHNSNYIPELHAQMLHLADHIRAIDAQRAELKNLAWPR